MNAYYVNLNLFRVKAFYKWFRQITAITIFPLGIFLNRYFYIDFSQKLYCHEFCHWRQQIELLGIFFYILYVLEFILKLPFYGFRWWRTYNNLSFEREANAVKYVELTGGDLYIKRYNFGFIKYIF